MSHKSNVTFTKDIFSKSINGSDGSTIKPDTFGKGFSVTKGSHTEHFTKNIINDNYYGNRGSKIVKMNDQYTISSSSIDNPFMDAVGGTVGLIISIACVFFTIIFPFVYLKEKSIMPASIILISYIAVIIFKRRNINGLIFPWTLTTACFGWFLLMRRTFAALDHDAEMRGSAISLFLIIGFFAVSILLIALFLLLTDNHFVVSCILTYILVVFDAINPALKYDIKFAIQESALIWSAVLCTVLFIILSIVSKSLVGMHDSVLSITFFISNSVLSLAAMIISWQPDFIQGKYIAFEQSLIDIILRLIT
ncbi:MAG: hypothetical protein K6E72_11935 [Saccharofermentans sp.]|nr:hypothetical protein [Saccharofermentans sp.]